MRDQVTLTEILDTQTFAEAARRYFRMPGIVQKFYPGVAGVSPPAVDVQPAVHDVRIDTTTGERFSEPWPQLLRIHVRYPSGGGYAMWWDLKMGDKVDLESFDLDPGPYLASGQPQDPAFTRRNSGAHWVAVPGDYTDLGALPPSNGQLCIGSPGGVIVSLDGSHVNLGSASPTDAVALASLVKTELTEIKTALTTLTVTTGAGAGGTVVAGTPYMGPGNIASGTVKCAP